MERLIRRVLIIINPASGTDYPILSVANRFFNKNNIKWEPLITLSANTIADYFHSNRIDKFDALLIYGGDGTIMDTVRNLPNTNKPLLVIPGGTANATAKEFGLPSDPQSCLELLLPNHSTIKSIDTYLVNGLYKSLIVSSLGSFSEAIKNTDRNMKEQLGFLSYVVNTSKIILNPSQFRFDIIIDNKKKSFDATALFVCNIGNFGLKGVPLHPNIDPQDGLLDLIILKDASLITLGQLALNNYFKLNPDSIIHLTGKEIKISADKPFSILIDDEFHKFSQVDFLVQHHSQKLLLPL